MNTKLTNHNGQLTAYGFACGYIENHVAPKGHYIKIHKDTCYHIRAFNSNHNRLSWECTTTLTEARNITRRMKRNLA